jgi:hypothetical protein
MSNFSLTASRPKHDGMGFTLDWYARMIAIERETHPDLHLAGGIEAEDRHHDDGGVQENESQ